MLTALHEGNVRAVATRGGLVSYLSVLGDRFCYVPQDVIVPGILDTADVGDIVTAHLLRIKNVTSGKCIL